MDAKEQEIRMYVLKDLKTAISTKMNAWVFGYSKLETKQIIRLKDMILEYCKQNNVVCSIGWATNVSIECSFAYDMTSRIQDAINYGTMRPTPTPIYIRPTATPIYYNNQIPIVTNATNTTVDYLINAPITTIDTATARYIETYQGTTIEYDEE